MGEIGPSVHRVEKTTTPRMERIRNGVASFFKDQMPEAHSARYMKFYDAIGTRLKGKSYDIAKKLRPTMEKAAKVAGVATTVGEIALSAIALYAGIMFLIDPVTATASAKLMLMQADLAVKKVYVGALNTASELSLRVQALLNGVIIRKLPVNPNPFPIPIPVPNGSLIA